MLLEGLKQILCQLPRQWESKLNAQWKYTLWVAMKPFILHLL